MRLTDMTEYSNPVDPMPPCAPGLYEFSCAETDFEVEKIEVVYRGGTLWAKMDGIWNTVETWHDGLTSPEWKRISP